MSVCLHYLQEYVWLFQQFQFYARRGCVPPIEVRIRLKILEAVLPSNPLQYLNLLLKYPHLCPGKPLVHFTDGCCENCGGEAVTAGGEAFEFCGNCNALLIPD